MYAFQSRAQKCPLTTFVFSASEGCLESAGSGTDDFKAVLPSGGNNYLDVTSYSNGTDPHHRHSDTERPISTPSGTPPSLEAVSLRNAFRRKGLTFLRTQEFGLSGSIHPRRPPPSLSSWRDFRRGLISPPRFRKLVSLAVVHQH